MLPIRWLIALSIAWVLIGPEGVAAPAPLPGSLTLEGFVVPSPGEGDLEVSAQRSGLLVSPGAAGVGEGDLVRRGDLLAQVDDLQARQVLAIQELRLRAAEQGAANDVNIRYCLSNLKAIEAECQEAAEKNKAAPGTIPKKELRALLLALQRAKLELEQAEQNLAGARLALRVHKAELEAAAEELNRYRITAPLDGVVVRRYRYGGEWVQAGEPVMRIIRMDRLQVEGFVDAKQVAPHELAGRAVLVKARVSRGRVETFQAAVAFVSPVTEAGGKVRIKAELENRREDNHWLLRPGQSVEMTISLEP